MHFSSPTDVLHARPIITLIINGQDSIYIYTRIKGKAVPLQDWSGPDKVPRLHDNGTGWW